MLLQWIIVHDASALFGPSKVRVALDANTITHDGGVVTIIKGKVAIPRRRR
jgi:hypothetical protein